MSTKKLLEDISTNCLSQLTKYKFNKQLDVSDKYRAGKLASLDYIQQLIYYFYERDRELKKEFQEIIEKQIIDAHKLKEGDYQTAVTETLKWVQEQSN